MIPIAIPTIQQQPIHPTMKTMIRAAAGILTAALVGLSTNCGPTYYPVEVYHHTYRSYDNSSPYYPGTVNYSRPDSYSGARGFDPVSRF